MSEGDIFELLRIVAVIALLVLAAAMATQKGRLPLALRGVARILRRDGTAVTNGTNATTGTVPAWKRLLAFALVLAAALLALI